MKNAFVLVGLAVLGGAILLYNSLIALRQLVKNAWADVDVYLKRRAELIPNLVAAVKGYASHEQALLEALATARSEAIGARSSGERVAAESAVSHELVQVLMLSENYPDLKATENFSQLQRELAETERHIASARQYYNACVRDLNTRIESFPSNLMAALLALKPQPFCEVDSLSEREAPSVARPV